MTVYLFQQCAANIYTSKCIGSPVNRSGCCADIHDVVVIGFLCWRIWHFGVDHIINVSGTKYHKPANVEVNVSWALIPKLQSSTTKS